MKKWIAVLTALLVCAPVHVLMAGRVKVEPDVHKVDVAAPTGLSAEVLESILRGTSLEGYGDALHHMEKTYGTNAIFAIAVATIEGGIESGRRDGKNNYFGLTYGGVKIRYASIEENIDAFGKLIQKPIYRNKTFYRFAEIYCPPNTDAWASKVSFQYRKYAQRANEAHEPAPDLYSLMLALKQESCEFM